MDKRISKFDDMMQLTCSLVASGAFRRRMDTHLRAVAIKAMDDNDVLTFEEAYNTFSKETIQEAARESAMATVATARILRTTIIDELDQDD